MAFLLRLLVDRLGLIAPEHRHKLRILASSASLPSEGQGRERSVRYLWDMFGKLGSATGPRAAGSTTADALATAIVPGEALTEAPAGTAPLPTEPFEAMVKEASTSPSEPMRPDDPTTHETQWRAIAAALLPGRSGGETPRRDCIRDCVVEAGRRIACAYWAEGDRPRPTDMSILAERLFSDRGATNSLRGRLFVRGVGDHAKVWGKKRPRRRLLAAPLLPEHRRSVRARSTRNRCWRKKAAPIRATLH